MRIALVIVTHGPPSPARIGSSGRGISPPPVRRMRRGVLAPRATVVETGPSVAPVISQPDRIRSPHSSPPAPNTQTQAGSLQRQ